MTPTEEPLNLKNLGQKHTQIRARPPLPLTMPGRRLEGKGSNGIADELELEPPPGAVVARVREEP
jgi:hypothetical protein